MKNQYKIRVNVRRVETYIIDANSKEDAEERAVEGTAQMEQFVTVDRYINTIEEMSKDDV